MDRPTFLQTMTEHALEARDRGAPINPAGAAVHAANESAYGRSILAVEGRNLFGTKAVGKPNAAWDGATIRLPTWEVVNGTRVNINAAFRRYRSWTDAFVDYGDLIARLYPAAAAGKDRDVAFLHGLFLSGPRRWATDPLAFDKACRILAQNHETLYPAGPIRVAEADTVVFHGATIRTALEVARGALDGGPIVLRSPAAVSVTNGRKVDVRWIGDTP